MKKLEEIRKNVLTEMEKAFVGELVPAILSGTEEGEFPVLNVYLTDSEDATDDTSGEFFFLPSAAADEIQYFVNLITIVEEIPEENYEELFRALAAVNFYVATGSFSVDFTSGTLVYKFMYPMPITATQETVKDNVDLSMGIALAAVKDYGYLLAEVCNGERDAMSVIEVLGSEIQTDSDL